MSLRFPSRIGASNKRSTAWLRFRPSVEVLETILAPALLLTVNTTDDADIRDNKLSIREAILISEGTINQNVLTGGEKAQIGTTADVNTIIFDIGAGTQTIGVKLVSGGALPAIKNTKVVISGVPPAARPDQWIVLDGSKAGLADGLSIEHSDCVVRGLEITGFALNGIVIDSVAGTQIGLGGSDILRVVINRNEENGILITGADASNSKIVNCYIGTDRAGLAAAGNHENGIAVEDGAHDNLIGQLNEGRNVISGNNNSGVVLGPTAGTGNTVSGNYIGTNASGQNALPNSVGVEIDSDGQIVGGTAGTFGGMITTPVNVISGNQDEGILILQPLPMAPNQPLRNITIQGNFVGLEADGDTPQGNGGEGIAVIGATDNLLIGAAWPPNPGLDPAQSNVVSKNGGSGIYALGPSTDLRIALNIVGWDKARTANRGNTRHGIHVDGAVKPVLELNYTSHNRGTQVLFENVTGLNDKELSQNSVGGGDEDGIRLVNCANVTLLSNHIGTDDQGAGNFGVPRDGLRIENSVGVVALGNTISNNQAHGIYLFNAIRSAVGGVNAGDGNTILNNALDGVAIVLGSLGNSILGNSIDNNGGLGIDLNDDGVTANDGAPDADIGPNLLQNYPTLTPQTSYASNPRTFLAELRSVPLTTFRIEFFTSVAVDPSGHGEGRTFVSATNVTTDAAGYASVTWPSSSYGSFAAATATNLTTGDTSEFSGGVLIVAPPEEHGDGPTGGARLAADGTSSDDPALLAGLAAAAESEDEAWWANPQQPTIAAISPGPALWFDPTTTSGGALLV